MIFLSTSGVNKRRRWAPFLSRGKDVAAGEMWSHSNVECFMKRDWLSRLVPGTGFKPVGRIAQGALFGSIPEPVFPCSRGPDALFLRTAPPAGVRWILAGRERMGGFTHFWRWRGRWEHNDFTRKG